MKIWVLEWYCSDDNSYLLEALFKDFDGIADYLAEKYPEVSFVDEHVEDMIKIWKAEYFVPEHERVHYSMDRSDFIAFEKEVR